jgi:hypothetical protein
MQPAGSPKQKELKFIKIEYWEGDYRGGKVFG